MDIDPVKKEAAPKKVTTSGYEQQVNVDELLNRLENQKVLTISVSELVSVSKVFKNRILDMAKNVRVPAEDGGGRQVRWDDET